MGKIGIICLMIIHADMPWFISRKTPEGKKHEIRHMLASNIVSLKTLYEKT